MRNSITHYQLTPQLFMQENSDKQNKNISEFVPDEEGRNGELEKELKKQKAPAEKGAKLMQIKWGDNFLSDSLH